MVRGFPGLVETVSFCIPFVPLKSLTTEVFAFFVILISKKVLRKFSKKVQESVRGQAGHRPWGWWVGKMARGLK